MPSFSGPCLFLGRLLKGRLLKKSTGAPILGGERFQCVRENFFSDETRRTECPDTNPRGAK